MTHHQIIPEDWERESLKDSLYLQEQHQEMLKEWQQWEEEQKKLKPAEVKVVKEVKQDEKQNNTVLPF